MARVRFACPLLIACVAAAWAASCTPACGGAWRHDFESARRDAERTGRPLLVHFSAGWCGPCRQMERDVLSRPRLLATLDREVIGCKLDLDRNRAVADRYRVSSIPADVLLTPDGRVLGQMTGRRDVGDYLDRVSAVTAQYARLRDRERLAFVGDPLTGGSGDPGPLAAPVRPSDEPAAGPERSARKVRKRLLGLRGFCPVTLREDREWTRGEREFAWEHQGITYFMATPEAFRSFIKAADDYAPKLLGCDPVVYHSTGRAVPGSTAYAALWRDELYLFVSEKNRREFYDDPERWVREKQVLLLDEIEDPARTAELDSAAVR